MNNRVWLDPSSVTSTPTLAEIATPAFTSTTVVSPPQTALPPPKQAGLPESQGTGAAGVQPAGPLTLIELPDNIQLPAHLGPVEFKWVWNEGGVCETPPDGQGFEVRIWPDLPGFGPSCAGCRCQSERYLL